MRKMKGIREEGRWWAVCLPGFCFCLQTPGIGYGSRHMGEAIFPVLLLQFFAAMCLVVPSSVPCACSAASGGWADDASWCAIKACSQQADIFLRFCPLCFYLLSSPPPRQPAEQYPQNASCGLTCTITHPTQGRPMCWFQCA